jgi:DNA gyrase subunit A
MVEVEQYVEESPFIDNLKEGFSEYAKYVIKDRALPDSRDGMKPVHRRIIWAMHERKLHSSSPNDTSNKDKCSAIFGDVTGKYHPHAGGTYESIVRLGQWWSLRYPLVLKQGNFGSIDGLPPAAMRYTEAKLAYISQELVRDISKNIVKFVPNWDGKVSEPTVLPVGLPHLLLNGTKGIAVGMSSNIPPHHLGELIDACIAIIDRPEISIDELMQIITGPDFPTGGIVVGLDGIHNLYHKGKGSIKIRSKIELETPENSNSKKTRLVVTEIPYFVSKQKIVEEIDNLIDNKMLRGVIEVLDIGDNPEEGKKEETKKKPKEDYNSEIRIEIEIDPIYAYDDDSVNTIKAQLFERTSLEIMFHANMLALVYGKPKTLNLKQALLIFLDFREEVVIKVAKEELETVNARIHILEGLIKALDIIDEIIDLIKKSDSRANAKSDLMNTYSFSDVQTDALLSMPIGRLARLERQQFNDELEQKLLRQAELMEIIHNREARLNLMKLQLNEVKVRQNDERRTQILHVDDIFNTTDREFVHQRTVLLSSLNTKYVRAIDFSIFNQQKRGGKGVKGIPIEDDEVLHDLVIASNKDELLLITKNGIVHKIPAYDIPEVLKRTAKGKKLTMVIDSLESEVMKIVPVDHDGFTEDKVLVTVTKNGMIKRTTLDKFAKIRKTGIRCLNFKEDDDFVTDAFVTDNNSFIFMASRLGSAVVFKETNARLVGRVSMGVKGMKLRSSQDAVVSSFAIPATDYETTSIFTVTENGYGKRTELSEYRITNRGAGGVRNLKVNSKTGYVVTSLPVPIDGEGVSLSLVNSKGILIRIGVKDIRVMGRSTQGVRVMRVQKGERVLLASHIVEEGEDEKLPDDNTDIIDENIDLEEDLDDSEDLDEVLDDEEE